MIGLIQGGGGSLATRIAEQPHVFPLDEVADLLLFPIPCAPVVEGSLWILPSSQLQVDHVVRGVLDDTVWKSCWLRLAMQSTIW